jgi:hypothetical protein
LFVFESIIVFVILRSRSGNISKLGEAQVFQAYSLKNRCHNEPFRVLAMLHEHYNGQTIDYTYLDGESNVRKGSFTCIVKLPDGKNKKNLRNMTHA